MLTAKQERSIAYLTKILFGPKSLQAPTHEAFKVMDHSKFEGLRKLVRLTNQRSVLLTDRGLETIQLIAKHINDAQVFDGKANYSDIYTSLRKQMANLLSEGLEPETGSELLELVEKDILSAIKNYTFIAPIYGIRLSKIKRLTVGTMKIVPPSYELLSSLCSVESHPFDITKIIDRQQQSQYLWMIGEEYGTPEVAKQRFTDAATYTIGAMATVSGALYSDGTARVRIGLAMSSDKAPGEGGFFHWPSDSKELSITFDHGKSHSMTVDHELVALEEPKKFLDYAHYLYSQRSKTKLQNSLEKAIYWYADAHKDPSPTMEFVKYWTCIESIFTAGTDEISETISSGVAAMMVWGPTATEPESKLITIKKEVKSLYDHRSKALHHGHHNHVKYSEIAQLSRWAAHTILSISSLIFHNYKTQDQVNQKTAELFSKFEKATDNNH